VTATCDGLRVRTRRAMTFHRNGAARGFFTVPEGAVGPIVDNEMTRAYTERAKGRGEDLVPVLLEGAVRFVVRDILELMRDG